MTKTFTMDLSIFFTQLDPFPNFLANVEIECCDNERLKGNKLLLCIGSPLLRHLMEFGTDPVIKVNGVHSKEMKYIIQFLHQGTLTLETHQIQGFLNAASDLQIQGLDREIGDLLRSEAPTPPLLPEDCSAEPEPVGKVVSEADTMIMTEPEEEAEAAERTLSGPSDIGSNADLPQESSDILDLPTLPVEKCFEIVDEQSESDAMDIDEGIDGDLSDEEIAEVAHDLDLSDENEGSTVEPRPKIYITEAQALAARLLRDLSNVSAPMSRGLSHPPSDFKEVPNSSAGFDPNPLDDSGIDLDGITNGNPDAPSSSEPFPGVPQMERTPRVTRRRYRLRPRSEMVMGISGKVWQCGNCDYWHYYQYAMENHRQRRGHRF